jgi:hypothetical protein
MQEPVFERFHGKVYVDFARAWCDDIAIDFTFHREERETFLEDDAEEGRPKIDECRKVAAHMWTSSVLSSFFTDMVHWLEAVVCGVRECAFQWEGEGPEGELRWFRLNQNSGRMLLVWDGHRLAPEARLAVFVSPRQMVGSLYRSFRDYVESDRYDPLAYEQLDVRETCSLVLEGGDVDAMTEALVALPRREAWALVDEMLDLAYRCEAGYPRRAPLERFLAQAAVRAQGDADEERWFPADWPEWDANRRREYVIDKVYPGRTMIGFGEKARDCRSPLVETWLAQRVAQETE